MKLKVVAGDITKMKADAIVNAANVHLAGGSGVDGAIHKAGGPAIAKACKKIIATRGKLKAGEAVATTAGKLNAKIVIHTAGPIWHGGTKNEAAALEACYTNSLKIAAENGCASVVFPAISTGVYGYPKEKAAQIAIRSVQRSEEPVQEVIFVVFDVESLHLYQQLLGQKER